MKKASFKIKCIFVAVICAGLFFWGVYTAYTQSIFYSNEREKSIEISSEKELLHFLNNGQVCTDAVLTKDIELTEAHRSLGTADLPYKGNFNGRGYTISFTGTSAQSALFGVLASTAVVENLGLECYDAVETEENYSLLAEINYGSIKNIRNLFAGELTFKTAGVYSYICLENHGTVANIVSYVNPVNRSQDAKPVVYGSACAYNYGTLASAFAIIHEKEYPSRLDTEQQASVNRTYGVLYGKNFGSVSDLELPFFRSFVGGIYPVYTSDISHITVVEEKLFFTREHIKNVMNFDSLVWDLESFDFSRIEDVLERESNGEAVKDLYRQILVFRKEELS